MSTLSTTNLKNPSSASNNIVLGADGSITVSALQGGITSGTAVASTSGTSIDFTGIPSWVKRVMVMYSGISTNGTSSIILQIGDSGGVETSGYNGAVARLPNANVVDALNFSVGMNIIYTVTAAGAFSGQAVFTLLNASTNLWAFSSASGSTQNAIAYSSGGDKALSATLDRVRLTTVNGTDTFDAGSINIAYEG